MSDYEMHISLLFPCSFFSVHQMNSYGARTGVSLVVFVVIVVTALIVLDTYDSLSRGKFNGNVSIVHKDVGTTVEEKSHVDLRMHVSLQSRLHTANIDIVECTIYDDSSLGHRHELLQGIIKQLSPVIVKPNSLWSSWDGSALADLSHDAASSQTRTMVMSNINSTNLDKFMSNEMPSRALMAQCVMDGSVDLFSLRAMRIPLKKHMLTVYKTWNHNGLETENSNDQDILQWMNDLNKVVVMSTQNDHVLIDKSNDTTDVLLYPHPIAAINVGNNASTLGQDLDMFPVGDHKSTHPMQTIPFKVKCNCVSISSNSLDLSFLISCIPYLCTRQSDAVKTIDAKLPVDLLVVSQPSTQPSEQPSR